MTRSGPSFPLQNKKNDRKSGQGVFCCSYRRSHMSPEHIQCGGLCLCFEPLTSMTLHRQQHAMLAYSAGMSFFVWGREEGTPCLLNLHGCYSCSDETQKAVNNCAQRPRARNPKRKRRTRSQAEAASSVDHLRSTLACVARMLYVTSSGDMFPFA